MRKDVKTGMMIGLVLVIIAFIWFSIKKPLSLETERGKAELELEITTSPAQNRLSQEDSRPLVTNQSEITTLPPLHNTEEDADEKIEISPAPRLQYHTVQKGETLVYLAEIYLGDPNRWPEILDLNKDQLPSPKRLRPGMRLVMPQR